MTFMKSLASAVLIAAALSCGAAAAGPPSLATAPSGPNGHLRQDGGSSGPLHGALRLNPTVMQHAPIQQTVLPLGIEGLSQEFHTFSLYAHTYELGVVAMPKITAGCLNKSYSIQDQMTAGCANSDTVGQCMDKLLKHCISTYYGPLGVPASYKDKAQRTADAARALSQKLLQYADQAEKAGSSW
jgi:hypothetical protein